METITGIFSDSDITCPACGNTQWKTTGQVKDYSISGEWFELKECTECHLKATYPQPPANQLGRYYASTEYISHSDTKSGLINKLFHASRNFMMKRKLDWVRLVTGKEKGNLLDVGAGTGHFAKYMQDHGWNVLALEPDENARHIGTEKLGIAIKPLESMPELPANNFDVITLWHVLEHVQDLSGYLLHFLQLLKQDGRLIIAVPNYTSRDAKHYGPNWAAYDVPRHLWHFSPQSMVTLLQRNGFRVSQKITMPLDGFYVSMLSEKYKGNDMFGPAFAFISGLRSFMSGRNNVDTSSSIIYVSKKSDQTV